MLLNPPANRCLKIVLLRWLFIHCHRRHKCKAGRCHPLLTHPSHSLRALFINSDVTFSFFFFVTRSQSRIFQFTVWPDDERNPNGAGSSNFRNTRKRGRSEKHREATGMDRLLLDAALTVVMTYVQIQRQLTSRVVLLACTISCPAMFGYFSSISPFRLSGERRRSVCHFCPRISC